MKTHNAFLILTLLLWSSLSHAFNTTCVEKEKTVAPPVAERTTTDADGSQVETQVWKDWKAAHNDWETRQNWGCCPSLTQEASTRICKDPSMQDQTLVFCENHGQCGVGQGCLPFVAEEHMFSQEADTDPLESDLETLQGNFETQQSSVDEPKSDGEFCYCDMDCESYSCQGLRCKAKKVCRFAEEDEIAVGNIQCEVDLVKQSGSNKCISESTPSFYTGLVGNLSVQQVGGQQCQFEIHSDATNAQTGQPLTPADVLKAVNLGIVTTRSMEWLFATSTTPDDHDCLHTTRWMRNNMKTQVEERKEILNAYNADIIAIEDNFKLVAAAPKGGKGLITSPCGDQLTEHDIAMRRATGLDFLCYMQNKNEVLKNYEIAMEAWVTKVDEFSKNYLDSIGHWGNSDKEWTIGGQTHSYGSGNRCRGRSKRPVRKIKNRWSQRYKVKGHYGLNKKVFDNNPGVKTYLDILGVGTGLFTKTHWLLEPLMPGAPNTGINFDSFGLNRAGDKRKLKGDSDGYVVMHQKMQNSLVLYYKSFNSAQNPQYVYEPEIPSSFETRGCIDRIDARECAPFKNYIKTIQDTAFAQMISYSRHYKRKFRNYFNKDRPRKHLFKRYGSDLTNLKEYYNTLAELHDKQNNCIQRVIDQLNGDDYKGGGQGIAEGGINYYKAGQKDYLGAQAENKNYKAKITQKNKNRHKFKLAAYNMTHNSGALKDSVIKSGAAGSGEMGGGAGDGSLAARIKEMTEDNLKNKGTGLKPADAEKEFMENLAGAGLLSSGSGTMAAANASSSSLAPLTSTGSAKLDDEEESKESGEGVAAVGGGVPAGAQAGAQAGMMGGIVGGFGSGSGSGSGSDSGSGHQDPTGMSDEEKEIMAANYDRNKSDYKTREDDSLFEVLSKTYVRNLDRV